LLNKKKDPNESVDNNYEENEVIHHCKDLVDGDKKSEDDEIKEEKEKSIKKKLVKKSSNSKKDEDDKDRAKMIKTILKSEQSDEVKKDAIIEILKLKENNNKIDTNEESDIEDKEADSNKDKSTKKSKKNMNKAMT